MSEPKLRIAASGFGGSGYYNPFTGEKVIGVTTTLGVLEKPGVSQWVADLTSAYAVANAERLLERDEEAGYRMLRFYHSRAKPVDFDNPDVDIHDYHAGVLHDAAELGTMTHDWLEAHYSGQFPPDLIRDEQAQMVEQFLIWDSEHEVVPIQTEVTVFGDRFGGTADLFAYVDGVPTCIDFKTSRNTYPTHWAQLAALGAAHSMALEVPAPTETSVSYTATKQGVKTTTHWEEHPVPAFERYLILHMRPDDVKANGEFVPAFCRSIPVSQGKIDKAYELFIAARDARIALRDLKKLEKEEA